MGRPHLRWFGHSSGPEVRERARWLLAVGMCALVVRLLYVVIVLRDYVPVSDAEHYHTLAAAVGDGRGMVHEFPFGHPHPTAFRPPLYPLLLGGLYAVTGPRLGAAQALNVALGTVVVVLAALMAWRLAGRRAAMVTGLLAAVYPPLVFNDGPPLSEPLGLLLLLAITLLLLDRRTAWAGAAIVPNVALGRGALGPRASSAVPAPSARPEPRRPTGAPESVARLPLQK